MKSIAYAGNDVHQKTITVAVFKGHEHEAFMVKTLKNDKHQVQKFYLRLQKEYALQACYEASSCGYVFYRWLKEIGIPCAVIAPSSIEQRKGCKIKTDKRDAQSLGKKYRNGELSAVHVPDEKEEAARSLTRLREQILKQQKQTKQYILKFLQLRDLVYKEGNNWTQKHWRYLRAINFKNTTEQFVFNTYLQRLEHIALELRSIDEQITALAFSKKYAGAVEKLRCFRGIDTLTAISMITEIIDFKRFRSAREIMAFLGVVPGQDSSGDRQRYLRITKVGNRRIRRLLVEAAWHYRHRPAITDSLKKRQEGQPQEVISHSWKAQKRLHNKYVRLFMRGKKKQQIIVALARELIGFVWSVMSEHQREVTVA
jgi:transposase